MTLRSCLFWVCRLSKTKNTQPITVSKWSFPWTLSVWWNPDQKEPIRVLWFTLPYNNALYQIMAKVLAQTSQFVYKISANSCLCYGIGKNRLWAEIDESCHERENFHPTRLALLAWHYEFYFFRLTRSLFRDYASSSKLAKSLPDTDWISRSVVWVTTFILSSNKIVILDRKCSKRIFALHFCGPNSRVLLLVTFLGSRKQIWQCTVLTAFYVKHDLCKRFSVMHDL